MFVAAGPAFVVSAHSVDALFYSGDIGLLSVIGWMIFWSPVCFRCKAKNIFNIFQT